MSWNYVAVGLAILLAASVPASIALTAIKRSGERQ